jgi:alginate O-acetyltransferase complex protein AlgI
MFFRASGAQQIGQFLRAMAGAGQGGLWSGQVTYLLLQFRWELLIALAAALPVKPALQRALEARRDTSRISAAALDYGASALALALGALSVLSLVNSGFNPFIYFQF